LSYGLKTPWKNGSTHVIFEPLEFLEKSVGEIRDLVEEFSKPKCSERSEKGDYVGLTFPTTTKAVSLQDQLRYDEPPAWYYPVRESLGGEYLRQRK
jgi:hypothetical protein